MDHYWIIIIIDSSISIKWCYLSILFVTGSSTEPALFHVGCRPSLHVGLHFFSTYIWPWKEHIQEPCQKGFPNTCIGPWKEHIHHHVRKACPTLTSDHVGILPTTLSERPSTHIWQPMSERLNTYIRPCEEPILHAKRDLLLHLTTNVRKAEHLHSTMRGTNPPWWKGYSLTSDNPPCQKGSALTSHPLMVGHHFPTVILFSIPIPLPILMILILILNPNFWSGSQ